MLRDAAGTYWHGKQKKTCKMHNYVLRRTFSGCVVLTVWFVCFPATQAFLPRSTSSRDKDMQFIVSSQAEKPALNSPFLLLYLLMKCENRKLPFTSLKNNLIHFLSWSISSIEHIPLKIKVTGKRCCFLSRANSNMAAIKASTNQYFCGFDS